MAERTNPFRGIRFVLRPGSKKLKIILILLIAACAAALAAVGIVQSRIRQQTQAALDQAASLIQENADLKEKQENLGSDSSIKDIAREELGLVDPDTVIIDPNS